MKNFKTIYEAKTASRLKEVIEPPTTKKKIVASLEQKFSEGDLQEYMDVRSPSAWRMQLLRV